MATPLISFEDAVNANNLDPNQTNAVYYADGAFANRNAVRARCPHAALWGITVTGLTGADVFAVDSETGDLNVPQTVAWVDKQVALGVKLITVYANLDRWENEGLLTALAHWGHRIKRWVANWNNVPVVPSWADADQFSTTPGVDHNVALADFFGDAPRPPILRMASAEIQVSIPDGTTGNLHFGGTFEAHDIGGHWTIRGLPGVVHWSGPGGGRWRIVGEPFNAKPLGG